MDYGYTHHELKVSWGRTVGSVLLTYLQYFCFLIAFQIGTIFTGQSLERSIDMEMVDLSTYCPHL